VFHLDVIGLKGINDRYGFHVGDVVLVEVARRLQAVANPWPAYRYSGDEFLVFARLPDVDAARAFGHDLRAAIDGPVAVPPGAFDPRPLEPAVRVAFACAIPGSDMASLQLDLDAASFGRLDLKPGSTGQID
jgi:diguanylate cyclase (GGDEF)-like protein